MKREILTEDIPRIRDLFLKIAEERQTSPLWSAWVDLQTIRIK